MQTPCREQGAAKEVSDQEHAVTNLSPPSNQALRSDGRYPHSDTCEELARSGLFDRETAHLLLAIARSPKLPSWARRLLAFSSTRMAVLEEMAEIGH
jgi:hypothetical protein